MGMSQQLITDELYIHALKALENLNQISRAAIRLRVLVAAKRHGVKKVAEIFDISTNTLRSWVKNFKDQDLEGLEYKKGRGRKSNVNNIHRSLIKEWLTKDPNLTAKQIVLKLKDELGVTSSESAIHRILNKLKLSHITPRPVHYKQTQESHEKFKKKSK